MEDWQVKLQIDAMAYLVEMEGMNAENIIRESKGESLAYTAEDFNYIASEMRNLAHHIIG